MADFTIKLNQKEYNALMIKLKKVSEVDQSAIIQKSLKSGMEMIVRAGKTSLQARNKKKTGNLLKSMATKTNKKRAASYGGFRRSSKKKKVGGGNHAHLIDRGTLKRGYRTKLGNWHNTGSIAAGRPQHGSKFWTDTVESKGLVAKDKLMNSIYESLSKIMNRKN